MSKYTCNNKVPTNIYDVCKEDRDGQFYNKAKCTEICRPDMFAELERKLQPKLKIIEEKVIKILNETSVQVQEKLNMIIPANEIIDNYLRLVNLEGFTLNKYLRMITIITSLNNIDEIIKGNIYYTSSHGGLLPNYKIVPRNTIIIFMTKLDNYSLANPNIDKKIFNILKNDEERINLVKKLCYRKNDDDLCFRNRQIVYSGQYYRDIQLNFNDPGINPMYYNFNSKSIMNVDGGSKPGVILLSELVKKNPGIYFINCCRVCNCIGESCNMMKYEYMTITMEKINEVINETVFGCKIIPGKTSCMHDIIGAVSPSYYVTTPEYELHTVPDKIKYFVNYSLINTRTEKEIKNKLTSLELDNYVNDIFTDDTVDKIAKYNAIPFLKVALEHSHLNMYFFLYPALRHDNITIIKMLLEKGADPNYILLESFRDNKIDIVKLLLEKGADINIIIRELIRDDNITIIKMLLEKGADPNYILRESIIKNKINIFQLLANRSDIDLSEMLYDTIYYDRIEMLKLALSVKSGIDVNPHIYTAMYNDKTEIFKYLLTKDGANIDKALDDAIYNDKIKIVKIILEKKGLDINTALNKYINNENIFKYLIKNGANIDKALNDAIYKNKIEIVKKILEKKGLDVNTALNKYINNEMIFKYLINNGANKDNALLITIKENKLELLKYLINNGADKDKALLITIKENKLEFLKYLIDNGADKDKALLESIKLNKIEIVKMILKKKGLDINTALNKYINNENIFKYLINNGADKNKALLITIKENKFELFKYLINNGANKDKALLASIKFDRIEMVQYLIDNGADKEKALLVSIKLNRIEIFKYLFKNSSNKEKALKAAKHWNKPEIIKLINHNPSYFTQFRNYLGV